MNESESSDRLPRSPHQSRRTLVTLLLVPLVLVAGVVTMMQLAALKQQALLKEATPRQYNVEVFHVAPADLQELISSFGTVRADREVVLGAQVAGEVIELHPRLRVGERIAPVDSRTLPTGEPAQVGGDVLVRIDPRSYQERVIQVQNRIAEAGAELDRLKQEETNLARLTEKAQDDLQDSQREFQKVEDLKAKGIATDSDLRRAQLELRQYEKVLVQTQNDRDLFPNRRDQVQRRLETLQNDLKLAQLDLERTSVRTPFAGVLSTVHVEQGQYLKPGDPLATVVDSDLVEVPLAVTLDDYAKLLPAVHAGKFPAVSLAEHETAPPRWQGDIVRMSPKADEQTRTVMVYVHVDNRQQRSPLLPGTFVHARIDGPLLKQVLVVPRDAVLTGRGFVEADGRATQKSVAIARTLHAFAVIESGFTAGDRVILSNLDVLYDGAHVAVQRERTLAEELASRRTRVARLVDAETGEIGLTSPRSPEE